MSDATTSMRQMPFLHPTGKLLPDDAPPSTVCPHMRREVLMPKLSISMQRNKGALICLLLLTLLPAPPALSGPLTVEISQARSDSGVVRCGLFADADSWRVEERALRGVEASIRGGKAHCDFGDVPQGEYAVAVFHARQGETKVEYGFLGKPRQGVGFSNNPSITFGAPGFDAAKFIVGAQAQRIEITLKY